MSKRELYSIRRAMHWYFCALWLTIILFAYAYTNPESLFGVGAVGCGMIFSVYMAMTD